MSLEWARARLLQHREALRRLCEAQAQQQAKKQQKRRDAEVIELRTDATCRPLNQITESGRVLKFEQPGRRRRA
jgi:hypothetical protein